MPYIFLVNQLLCSYFINLRLDIKDINNDSKQSKTKNKHLKANEVSLLTEVNKGRVLAPRLLKGG